MLAPKKSLGQNFLRDENVARKIVASLHVLPNDIILEVGPGQGDLTRFLLETPGTVVGVELDPRAAGILRERFSDRLSLLVQDVLSLDLGEFVHRFGGHPSIVGNIPYYITSDILFWMIDQRQWITKAIVMMQSEVAARLVARTNSREYGILSVFAQLFADTSVLFRVSRNSFHPRPQVDSAVVRFEFGKPQVCTNERLFRNIVRQTFGSRRKMLRNSLKMMGYFDDQLEAIPFDLQQRPEQVPPAEFIRLYRLLEPHSATLALKY